MTIAELKSLLAEYDDPTLTVAVEVQPPCRGWFTPGGEPPTVDVKTLYRKLEAPELVLVPCKSVIIKEKSK